MGNLKNDIVLNTNLWTYSFSTLEFLFPTILLFAVFVDMGLATSNPITLTVVTSSGNSFSRSFSIKVTQIDCTSLNKGTIFQ